MKPRDLFKLAVQILGLIFLYHGLTSVPMLFSAVWGGVGALVGSVLMVGWPLLVAWWLLSGARPIMGIAYPDSED
jgi:hypothetical protein